MAQRLAMRTKLREENGDLIIFSSDFREFVRRMDELGNIGPRGQIRVEKDEDGIFFWIPIPGSQRVLPTGKKVVIKRKTKKEIAVAEQIATHKKNVQNKVPTPGRIPGVGVKPTKKRRVRIVKK